MKQLTTHSMNKIPVTELLAALKLSVLFIQHLRDQLTA
jgi:hypothetical protein